MYSFSRKALFLVALVLFATVGSEAQSSTTEPQQPATSPSTQSGAAQPTPTQSSMSVQARIKARREQRRTAAIKEVYTHLYEAYGGTGFTRTLPGPGYQHFNLYSWDIGVSRYFSERLGVTLDGRGSYGTAYIGNNAYNVNHPAISQYSGMIGPTYRFILQPRYSVSARVLGGGVFGNFSGDTDGFGTKLLGLYPDGAAFAISASVPLEYNVSPQMGVRIAPEYLATGFGSTVQNGYGLTGGVVFRWGKQ
jgi:hypothetical protein